MSEGGTVATEAPPVAERIETLKDELRTIAPEVVAGESKAKTRALKLREEIDSLELHREMESFAQQEANRRAEEERKAKAEQARREAHALLVGAMKERVALAGKVERALGDLVSAADAFTINGRTVMRLQRQAGKDPDHKLKDAKRLIERIETRLHKLNTSVFRRHATAIDLTTECNAVLDSLKAEGESS